MLNFYLVYTKDLLICKYLSQRFKVQRFWVQGFKGSVSGGSAIESLEVSGFSPANSILWRWFAAADCRSLVAGSHSGLHSGFHLLSVHCSLLSDYLTSEPLNAEPLNQVTDT